MSTPTAAPTPEPSASAVFLSYAREDTSAALRIAEALRSQGVEVWFDQSELRGGDAWDQKIRRQINECSLFIPIISQHTQARSKGYFRLEWKLAVEQTHLMLEGVPYLAPVVIDSTPDAGAAVPTEFLRVQWIRLPGALPTPQFVGQVKLLLDAPVGSGTAFRSVQRGSDFAPFDKLKASTDREVDAPPTRVGRALRARLGWIAGATAFIILLGAFGWKRLHQNSDAVPPYEPAARRSAPPTSEKPALDPHRIAVLPLDNFSPDAKDEYLAGGMTEELTSSLSKISGLEVISRTSSDRIKKAGKNLSEIGAELRAGTLLEGSVSKAGDQLRISVQLIDVASQRHLWSHNYDAEFKDVFKMRSDVAERVAEALKVKLLGTEVQRLKKEPTANLEAYQLYLKGRFHWFKWSEEGAIKAREYFTQALVVDPNYALAYSGIADTWNWKAAPRQVRLEVGMAASKALELDDTLAEAHLSMAWIKFWLDWNWDAAEIEFKRALALKPSLAIAHDGYGHSLISRGRIDEGFAEQKKAVDLDPTSAAIMTNLGWSYYDTRKYEQAIDHGRKAIELDASFMIAHTMVGFAFALQGKPAEALAEFQKALSLGRNPWNIGHLGFGYARAGKPEEARRIIAELDELSKQRYVCAGMPALIYMELGEKERMFEWLEKMVADRDTWCVWLKQEPVWEPVRSDPRFQALMKKVGLEK
ncbi:MAG: TIR domain-containing protein [Verrucomicrobia bacterium]|nr:TIR domain-containing protein [Verrucomicrobiota bacterium]